MNVIKRILAAAPVVATAMISSAVVAATTYTVTPLSPSGKRVDADNFTNILTMQQDSPALAHLNIVIENWSNGGRNYSETRPGSLPGATRSWGNAFNDAGQLTGYAETANAAGDIYAADGTPLNQTRAFTYSNGAFTDLSELLPLTRGPVETNGFGSTGAAINSQGEVVGSWTDASGTHAFLYSYGTMTDLGALGPSIRADTRPTSINSVAQITGSSTTSVWSGPHAFIYQQHLMQDLGVIGANPWSAGRDINDMGVVIGTLGGAPHMNRCFIYQDGVMSDLGTLGGPECFANKINNAGTVVGNANPGGAQQHDPHAFVYMDHTMSDLNALVDPPNALTLDNAVLVDAIGINDKGEILAVDQSYGRFFLLTPIPAVVAPPVATVAISVAPNPITLGDDATLTWSSTNATSCTASGAWSGTASTSGSASATPTAAGPSTYTLSCTGSGGAAVASTALTVSALPTPPPVVTPPVVTPPVATPPADGGGGGAFGIESLLGLAICLALSRRRQRRANRE